MSKLDDIKAARSAIYGEPKQNHGAIAMMWAPVLREFRRSVGRMVALPEWVVAWMLSAFKLCRMRRGVFHEDNYDDLANYALDFCKNWQKDWYDEEVRNGPRPLNIYVSGPYSSPDPDEKARNIQVASDIGLCLMRKGHHVLVPHTATCRWDGHLDYEDFMRLDETFVKEWADAIFFIGSSPGADRELLWAQEMGLTVFRNYESVPTVKGSKVDQNTPSGPQSCPAGEPLRNGGERPVADSGSPKEVVRGPVVAEGAARRGLQYQSGQWNWT